MKKRSPHPSTMKDNEAPNWYQKHQSIINYYGRSDDSSVESIRSIQNRWQMEVDRLRAKAHDGSREHMKLLAQMAVYASMAIGKLTDEDFAMVHKIARQAPYWPVLIDPSPKSWKEVIPKLWKSLDLGIEYIWPVDLKKIGRTETTARDIALQLFLIIDALRWVRRAQGLAKQAKERLAMLSSDMSGKKFKPEVREFLTFVEHVGKNQVEENVQNAEIYCGEAYKSFERLRLKLGLEQQRNKATISKYLEGAEALPDLDQKSRKAWVTMGMRLIKDLTNNRPATNPILLKLGLYRKDAYYNKLKKQGKTAAEIKIIKASGSAASTENDNIEDGISTAIDGAFTALLSDKSGN
jgi:hypothetical protein